MMRVSTDTRQDIRGTVFYCLKGPNFDANEFVEEALTKGATRVITEDPKFTGRENALVVENVLKKLQEDALTYRRTFTIPLIAIGGSNGKTTSKELCRDVLRSQFRTYATEGNLNNHIGVPLALLNMAEDSEIAIFELGANHAGEHTELLDILEPTHVVITNNGLDHLEGFGSPALVRMANKEIYDWARAHSGTAFVNQDDSELIADSEGLERVLYSPTSGKGYETKLFGQYNLPNISLALAIGRHFGISDESARRAIAEYEPTLKRSQFLERDSVTYILDCYNANPSSMMQALESFTATAPKPRGVILGDMLELGQYAETEHKKIVDFVSKNNFDLNIFIGSQFKKALEGVNLTHQWFPDSPTAYEWFNQQNFSDFTLLLKGSRGLAVEKVIGL